MKNRVENTTERPTTTPEFKNEEEWTNWMRAAVHGLPIDDAPGEVCLEVHLKLPPETWLFVIRAAINNGWTVEDTIRDVLLNSQAVDDLGNKDQDDDEDEATEPRKEAV